MGLEVGWSVGLLVGSLVGAWTQDEKHRLLRLEIGYLKTYQYKAIIYPLLTLVGSFVGLGVGFDVGLLVGGGVGTGEPSYTISISA